MLVGQNVIFDYSFLKQWSVNHGQTFERNAVDTLKLAGAFFRRSRKRIWKRFVPISGSGVSGRTVRSMMRWRPESCWRRLKQEIRYGTARGVSAMRSVTAQKTDARNGASDGWPQEICCALRHPETEIPEQMTRSEASRLLDRWIAVHGRMPRD